VLSLAGISVGRIAVRAQIRAQSRAWSRSTSAVAHSTIAPVAVCDVSRVALGARRSRVRPAVASSRVHGRIDSASSIAAETAGG
jgi:hypothetical protein